MSTTAEKLTYLNTTKNLIKEELNLGGANITNEPFRAYKDKLEGIYKDFLANGTDTLWNNWLPKVTGTGETITLNNTIEAKMDFVYKGNTSQESTTGYNLFKTPYNESSKTKNGITFTINEDGSIHVEGTATAKTQFALRNKDKILDLSVGETYTFTASGLGVINSTIWLDTYATGGNFLGKWALTSTNYYTTAVAQERDTSPAIYITVENGATVNTNIKVWIYKGSYDAGKGYEPYTNGASPNPDYPQNIQVVSGENTIIVSNSDNTQSQSYPISLGDIELCKIGDYQDSIVKDNGKWYLNKQINKRIFNGTENWNYQSQYPRFQLTSLSPIPLNNSNLFCSHYIKGQTADTDYVCSLASGTGYSQFLVHDERFSTKATLNQWLSSNNVLLYYVLATPTTTEITDTTLIYQLEATKKSYNNQTNISQENSKEAFILDVTALGN